VSSDAFNARIDVEAAAAGRAVAFHAVRLDTGETLSREPDRVVPPASVIKLAAMVAAYEMVERGELDLGARRRIAGGTRAPGSGLLRYLSDEAEFSLRDLVQLMIGVSDNVATAEVLRTVGIGRMNRLMASLGYPHFQLIFPPRQEEGPLGQGTATAREVTALLVRISRGDLVSGTASAEMRRHLAGQQYNDQVARYLPFNLYGDDRGESQPVRVLNKTGFSVGVRADAGIVEVGESGFAVATFAWAANDRGFYPEHPGNLLNGTVARLVFERWYGDQLVDISRTTPIPAHIPPSARSALQASD
jgi:beta-lactamase class A